MMNINLLAFGIVKDIFQSPSLKLALPENSTVDNLKSLLNTQYPALKQLAVYMIAVNEEYAPGNEVIREDDEIAVIPPVSGG